MSEGRGITATGARSLPLGVSMLVASVLAATIIYFRHPTDPHDGGSLVAIAAALWPFVLCPITWLVCCAITVFDHRRGRRRSALIGLLFATIAWPTVFSGYFLNQKPWLSPRQKLADAWPDVRARGALELGSEKSPEA